VYSGTVQQSKIKRDQILSALETVDKLEARLGELIDTINSVDASDRENLEVLLPQGLNDIDLLVHINDLVLQQGYFPEELTVSASGSGNDSGNDEFVGPQSSDAFTGNGVNGEFAEQPMESTATIGTLDNVTVSFSVDAGYPEFIDLLENLEKSLRILDVVSIEVGNSGGDDRSSDGSDSGTTQLDDGVYTFKITLRVYGLTT